ncbi:ATP-binding cassette domain-containing protein [Sinorhizobium medicae]|uniref:ATP-binding cassette domain-containing protein n=2 Tax=Sinorhizobium medicae TaxID=110321 RepID=A0A6G1WIA7_9HYPH|nr:ABC transporter ATP-binding protein [Sinorhizobium medicae]ABR62771.1 ABC transporter related [Sinorhizobium medicae WSM419]MBO1942463.1 ABC transporter ATP-binding protein [Sinorhizobium medicae]MDX0403261.1 ATP-binding cassette domain-containing protein [Sinorhizobium medicae]MDX0409732.1 ATP-binding cassette domain-containing protein [Sinorhizobium medicae]MDX0415850.1 ATP-binding cassette domain-containing protein [Sinorhizobium medicae]
MPTINLRGAQKNYGVNSANAVSDLDLEIRDGEFMCLLGPSGCGKTTTLRMIAGLENLSGGEIRVGDRVVDCVSGGVFVPPEKREMGLVFQSYALWPHLTIERNTDFGLRLRKLPKAEREERVERVMQALDIAKYRDRYPSQLSGGQQQRVALARMLAINPGVLLLDEPLSNLDARLRLEMRAELKRLHKEFKTTIVFVTHDQWEAMTLATTIAVMNEGTLQQIGTPNDIYDRPANRFVAEFVGSPPINILDFGDPGTSDVTDKAEAYLAAHLPGLRSIGSVGIRPEAIGYAARTEDVPEGSFSGETTVTGVLPTGGNWILELRTDNHTLFLTTHVPPRVEQGARVLFFAPPEALHVFDADGRRIAEADDRLRSTATYN